MPFCTDLSWKSRIVVGALQDPEMQLLTKAREKEIADEERDELVTLCIVRVKNRTQGSRSNIGVWSA